MSNRPIQVGDIVTYYNATIKQDVHARVIRVFKDFNYRTRAIVTHYDAHTIPNTEIGCYELRVVSTAQQEKDRGKS